jgi:predicted RecA/RadA family phage recombinase
MAGLRLVAELGGDGSGFDAMMRRANTTKDKFGAQFSGLKNIIAGAFTVGAITNLTRQTIQFASHLRDVSDALRVNVEWFQKRANAAKLAGGSEDDLFKFIDTMSKTRSAAVQNPQGTEAGTLGRLGFSGAEISGLNTMEFFDRIVKAFGTGATAQTAVDVEKVGGRTARNLLAAFGQQFQSDAAVMSEQMVDALDDIGDQFTVLKNLLMVEFAPAIKFLMDAILLAVNQLKQAGAFLGGLTSKVSAFDAVKIVANPVLGLAKLTTDALAEGLDAAWGEAADQQDRSDKSEMQVARARAARKAREQAGPGFEPLDAADKKTAAARGPQLSTDALVGIGNFLGRNTSLVNNVAEQTLQVARQQLTATLSVRTAIDNLARLNSTSSGTLGIPGT